MLTLEVNNVTGWVWWFSPVIPALRRLEAGSAESSRAAWATEGDCVLSKTQKSGMIAW